MELQRVMVTQSSDSGEKEKTLAEKQEAAERLSLLELEEKQLAEQTENAEKEIVHCAKGRLARKRQWKRQMHS